MYTSINSVLIMEKCKLRMIGEYSIIRKCLVFETVAENRFLFSVLRKKILKCEGPYTCVMLFDITEFNVLRVAGD